MAKKPSTTHDFVMSIRKCARAIMRMGQDDPIFVFSHIDADGLAAASILASLLTRLNKPFIMYFQPQIVPETFQDLWNNLEPKYAIFLDLGTDTPSKIIEDSPQVEMAAIIDHHICLRDLTEDPRISVANPRVHGIDGGAEICSAGVAYLIAHAFSKNLSGIGSLARFAIIGAIGDSQDVGRDRSLIGLNRMIVDYAKRLGVVTEQRDLLFIGRGIKPLYRLLAELFTIEIPGISGSYDGALDFLTSSGVLDQKDIETTYLDDLPRQKKDLLRKKLIERIMIQSPGKYTIETIDSVIMGMTYKFQAERRKAFMYARDSALLLNACGKMKKPHIGVAALLSRGSRKYYEEVIKLYDRYRALIANTIRHMEERIERRENILAIFDGRDLMHEELASTVCSIMSVAYSQNVDIVMVVARSLGNILKVSLRKTQGSRIDDLAGVLSRVLERMKWASGGGHEAAAGAYVLEEEYDKFIELLVTLAREKS